MRLMNRAFWLLTILMLSLFTCGKKQNEIILKSPDNQLVFELKINPEDGKITYSVAKEGWQKRASLSLKIRRCLSNAKTMFHLKKIFTSNP